MAQKNKTKEELVKEIGLLQKRIVELEISDSARKKAEEVLIFNNIILRTQQELSIDGILVVDEKGKILFFNQRFVNIWGIPLDVIELRSDERVQQSVMDKLASPEEFARKVKHLYETRDEICNDEVVLKDGRVFDRYSVSMFDAEGEYYGRVWYFRDITERKKAEEALRESENRLQSVLSTIQESVTFSNETGYFYVYNLAMEKLTGYSMKEANACPDFISLLYPDPKNRQMALKGIVELLEKRTSREIEIIITTKSGQFRNVSIFSSLISYNGRNLFLSVYRDITERKQAEEVLQEACTELKETQAQLIQAEKMEVIGRLASGVAHEVKNPLGIILQGVNYLEGKISSEEKDMFEIVQMMKNNIKRADNIVCALLEFSRAGELNLKAEDINSILESSLSLVRYKINPPDIEIFKELASDLPKVSIDSNKMEQVFINLLLNAVDAMPRGGKLFMRSYPIQLHDSKNDLGRRNGNYFKLTEKAVVVQIEDTGNGILEENLRKVFDPFFTTKGPKNGVGLGLAVTKNIIDMHKGIIDIESKVGKGTKVSIILRIA
ncbi:MAG: PAS domain S-box protein [Candidatus Omnitrophota bacterium]|nr:PAS domain S-box protein [Candidatus Omnitrophota bacterium]